MQAGGNFEIEHCRQGSSSELTSLLPLLLGNGLTMKVLSQAMIERVQ